MVGRGQAGRLPAAQQGAKPSKRKPTVKVITKLRGAKKPLIGIFAAATGAGRPESQSFSAMRSVDSAVRPDNTMPVATASPMISPIIHPARCRIERLLLGRSRVGKGRGSPRSA